MKKVNALQLRQSLTKIIDTLKCTGEPILLEKGRKPAAVLISIKDYEERFSEFNANQARRKVVSEISSMAQKSKNTASAEDILREFREG